MWTKPSSNVPPPQVLPAGSVIAGSFDLSWMAVSRSISSCQEFGWSVETPISVRTSLRMNSSMTVPWRGIE